MPELHEEGHIEYEQLRNLPGPPELIRRLDLAQAEPEEPPTYQPFASPREEAIELIRSLAQDVLNRLSVSRRTYGNTVLVANELNLIADQAEG